MKTYTSSAGPIGFLRDSLHLYKVQTRDLEKRARDFVWYMNQVAQRVRDNGQLELKNLDILLIGPGQRRGETSYFGKHNRVTAIDLDVVSDRYTMKTYLDIWRKNGAGRAIKTIGRRVLGVDNRAEKTIKDALELKDFPKIDFHQMDAAQMTFPDESFDFIYSFSVFEHLPDPAKVIREINRVLRPGGVCYISLHLFTSDSGCHDVRIWADINSLPRFAHLRPQHENQVQPNAYLNKLRLTDWKRIFQEETATPYFQCEGHHKAWQETLDSEIAELRAQGELQDYADEELRNVNLIAIWKK